MVSISAHLTEHPVGKDELQKQSRAVVLDFLCDCSKFLWIKSYLKQLKNNLQLPFCVDSGGYSARPFSLSPALLKN